MRWAGNRERSGTPGGVYRALVCAVFLFLSVAMTAAQQGQQAAGNPSPVKDQGQSPSGAGASPQAVAATQSGAQAIDPAIVERRKQMTDDGAKLLALASDLKAEVDRTNQDTLSLEVVRKAEEIEKLAHAVKERMKQAAGGN